MRIPACHLNRGKQSVLNISFDTVSQQGFKTHLRFLERWKRVQLWHFLYEPLVGLRRDGRRCTWLLFCWVLSSRTWVLGIVLSDTISTLYFPNEIFFFYHGATAPSAPSHPHYRGFTITLRHITVGRTPLDEWSAGHGDLYLTTHNDRHPCPLAGFEPTIPASERPQTHALDRAATGISTHAYTLTNWERRYIASLNSGKENGHKLQMFNIDIP